jgi:hypothetical protein
VGIEEIERVSVEDAGESVEGDGSCRFFWVKFSRNWLVEVVWGK